MTPSSGRLRLFLSFFFSKTDSSCMLCPVRFCASAGTGGRTSALTAAHCDAERENDALPVWAARLKQLTESREVLVGVDAHTSGRCCQRGPRCLRSAAAFSEGSRLDTWLWAQICPGSGSEREGRGRGTPPVSPHLDCRDNDLNRDIPRAETTEQVLAAARPPSAHSPPQLCAKGKLSAPPGMLGLCRCSLLPAAMLTMTMRVMMLKAAESVIKQPQRRLMRVALCFCCGFALIWGVGGYNWSMLASCVRLVKEMHKNKMT